MSKAVIASNQIKVFEIERVILKESLFELNMKKLETEKEMDLEELYTAQAVLSNPEFKNEAQRKTAITLELNKNGSHYIVLQNRIERLETEIFNKEIELRKNLIEINFVTRAYEICMKEEK